MINIKKLFIMGSLVPLLLSGCHTTITNQESLKDTSISYNYLSAEDELSIPIDVIKTRMQKLSLKCGYNVPEYSSPMVIDLGAGGKYIYEIKTNSPKSFTAFYAFDKPNKDEKIIIVRMQFDAVTESLTKVTSQYSFQPIFLASENKRREHMLEWATGEHEFCL